MIFWALSLFSELFFLILIFNFNYINSIKWLIKSIGFAIFWSLYEYVDLFKDKTEEWLKN